MNANSVRSTVDTLNQDSCRARKNFPSNGVARLCDLRELRIRAGTAVLRSRPRSLPQCASVSSMVVVTLPSTIAGNQRACRLAEACWLTIL